MEAKLKDPSTWIPKEVFLAYVGGAPKLSGFYDKAVSQKKMMVFSLNWLALLLFPAWLGYRKQWMMFAVYTGLFALLPVLEAFFHFAVPNGAFIGINLFFGLQANAMLLTLAHARYLKLKKEGLPNETILGAMKDQARGSISLAIAALFVFLVLTGVGVFIADYFQINSGMAMPSPTPATPSAP